MFRLATLALRACLFAVSLPAAAQNVWEPYPLVPPALDVAPYPASTLESAPDASTDALPACEDVSGLNFTVAAIPDPLGPLAPPANSHFLFSNEISEPPGVVGVIRGLPIVLESSVKLRVDSAYDTGFVGSGIKLLPSTIGLDGTTEARRRGQFLMSASPSTAFLTAKASTGEFRGDIQIDFLGESDSADIRHLKGQALLPSDDVIYGGTTWTTFTDEYAVPVSINPDTTAAGTVYRRQPQLGYYHVINPFTSFSTAIEYGPTDDYTLVAADDQRIKRWPDLILRWRWSNSLDPRFGDSLHVATLLRSMGREDIGFEEDFATGWGVSVMLKMAAHERDHFFAGFVGGDGLGSYIFGFLPLAAAPADNMPAAGPVDGRLTSLSNWGAHVGYRRVWRPECSQSNLGFGYAAADTATAMPLTATDRLTNAWINHQWRITDKLSIGVEYHYAIRESRTGLDGDNHRLMFTTQFY